MNVLLVYAHPEPTSLNGTLKAFTVERLQRAGHTVQVSDLHAMQWKAQIDADDHIGRDASLPFHASLDSREAFKTGRQSADIAAEQEKLRWADAVILQFPLWWFSMPAILKGWVDRVYAYGFAYGVGEHSDRHWGDRYGEGAMSGKRAMLVVTTGGWESHYGPRGINGPIDDVLFPIQHGILFYPGFDVLPAHVIYRSSRIDEASLPALLEGLGARLDGLASDPVIAYRRQNAGDYLIPSLELRPGISAKERGLGIHLQKQVRPDH